MSDIIISPSILSANFINLGQEIQDVTKAGAQWIHIDVMDGHFVPNITIGVPVVQSIRNNTSQFLDVHLMIENPLNYIQAFANAGADLLTFHLEACKNQDEVFKVINLIKKCNKKVGLSIKPKTEPQLLLPYISDLDLVLIMTVEPGFGGQEFMHECASKIPYVKQHANNNLIIQVDGGINNITSKICTSLGATSLVAGSYIYRSENYTKAVKNLLN